MGGGWVDRVSGQGAGGRLTSPSPLLDEGLRILVHKRRLTALVMYHELVFLDRQNGKH